jgi:TolB-like protein/AraC-like DNA-binding protein/Tfp pilus assembly protein PilF
MSKNFIDEVRAIVMSNIADEKFGVRKLASILGLSSSQTLRKVKAATGKSVNQYIRELRLEKGAKLIKKTDFTIAEISYQVGFGYPSYFNKTFCKYYGIAPGEYKTQSFTLSELATKNTKNKSHNVFSNKKIFYVISIVMVFVIGYLLINNSTSKKTSFSNSIAVLPFKDMSPENSQWFSDGVSDNIIHSLSQIQDLSVISYTSSSTYRDTDKQIPEIAKELGVSYILEGSVVLYEDKIKIIAQLIDSNDEHVWSKEYNENFDDIITIQNNVAQEVMNQLEVTLSTNEMEILEKYPTQNMEAYNLHLKGRLVNDSRRLEDIKLNIKLNKQAIALDSTFDEAYTEIAFSYILLSNYHAFTIDQFEARDKAAYYANKALQIDSSNYKALVVKGGLLCYVDWDKAREYSQKAISINPNYAQSRTFMGLYFLYKPNPDFKKSLEQFRIAFQLDPLSSVTTGNLLGSMTLNKKLKEAEEHLKKTAYLLNEEINLNYKYIIIALKNKDWTTVIPLLKTKIKKDPNNALLYHTLGIYYDNILNDDATAITYFKKAFEIDSLNTFFLSEYISRLVEGKRYKEGKNLMQSENYRSIVSERSQLNQLWHFYYHKEEYQKAHEVLKDSLFTNQYLEKTITYAQLGDRKKVDSMNKRYPWGTGRLSDFYPTKARIHAILEDRDSMYYYLENIGRAPPIIVAINEREFDPYRNEDRFKAFLRKNYLPVASE